MAGPSETALHAAKNLNRSKRGFSAANISANVLACWRLSVKLGSFETVEATATNVFLVIIVFFVFWLLVLGWISASNALQPVMRHE